MDQKKIDGVFDMGIMLASVSLDREPKLRHKKSLGVFMGTGALLDDLKQSSFKVKM